MTLAEYRASTDSNDFWRLSEGHHQNLLDEACDRLDELEAALDAKTAAMAEMHAAVNRASAEYTAMSAEVRLLRTAGRTHGYLDEPNGSNECCQCATCSKWRQRYGEGARQHWTERPGAWKGFYPAKGE